MDRRKVLIIVAALVAAMGTALVFVYVKGADGRADAKYSAQSVLVASTAISPGETMSAAMTAGKVVTRTVTSGSVVPGAITDTKAIPGADVALTTIYPGEQILTSKFGASASGASTLGIPKDQIAISINLDDPGRVAGFVNPGDHVVIFATETGTTQPGANGTRVLLPDVTVIGVGSTTTVATTTTDASGAQTTEQLPRTLMTLALSQTDAQKVIYAKSGDSTMTFGLRSKTSQITKAMAPVNMSNLFS